MPPQSRGGLHPRPRGLGVHSKSTPNFAANNKSLEPFPPILETSINKGPHAPTTKSTSTPVRSSNSPIKTAPSTAKIPSKQSWATPTPLTKATLDGAQQALKQATTFLPGAPSEPSPELESATISEHDFAFMRGVASSTSASDASSDEEQEDFSGLLPPLPSSSTRRPLYSFASRSHSSLGLPQHELSRPHSVHALAPPFYNRPPTPLPPSPSLTSLLRPLPFSALPSRATTPDSSDTEAPSTLANAAAGTSSSTAAVVAHSARTATTVPRASPKVPTYEYYGFVLYLGSSIAFAMYLLWSYLPTPFLHQLGIYYYPDRWWSLAIPAWLVMVIVYIFVALAAYNTGRMTLGMCDLGCLVDEKADVAVVDGKGRLIRVKRPGITGEKEAKPKGHTRHKSVKVDAGIHNVDAGAAGQELDWKTLWNEGTDAVMDVPLGGVCEILYGSSRESDEDEDDDDFYD